MPDEPVGVPTPLDVWSLETRRVGRRVLVFESLPSTNDAASALALDPTNDGAIVLAHFQTDGRGQHGRSWQSRPGASLLMSVLVSPPLELRRPVVMTAWAAVSLADAVFALTGIQARVKWPNDVLVHGKKVCGILIEQRAGLVVGIGLNLNQSADDFAALELPEASSLSLNAGRAIDFRTAAVEVIGRLDDEYDRLLAGEIVPLEANWKWRVGLLGRHVEAELMGGSRVVGRLRDLTFEGAELEVGNPGIRTIRPEQIRHLRAVV